MKALIIEDEKRTAQNLLTMLKNIEPDIEIIQIIPSVEEAIDWFLNNNSPDLIFMDIQLSDGISFEIFEEVKIEAPIIFTTSYDEYAIKAFEVNGVDYLLKPVEPKKLEISLQKFHKYHEKNKPQLPDLKVLLKDLNFEKPKYKTRFLVKFGSTFISVPTEEAAYFYIENELTYLITKSNKKYTVDFTLEELEEQLNPDEFFRLNRQFISNIQAIGVIHSYSNNTLKIELKPTTDKEVTVSRYNLKKFKMWMEK